MSESTDRPQDAGRRHERSRSTGAPAPGSLSARWRDRLRDELEAVIGELTPSTPAPGLLPDVAGPAVRPSLERRRSLVELGAKIAAALGPDVDPPAPPAPPARARRVRRPDFG